MKGQKDGRERMERWGVGEVSSLVEWGDVCICAVLACLVPVAVAYQMGRNLGF